MSCNRNDIQAAAALLKEGSLVIIPTDTVYGIAADPKAPGARKRLCEAKGRDRNKPIPLLAAGMPDVVRYGATLNESEQRLAAKFWPGPLTLVLRVGDVHEGFRVPDNNVAMDLLKAAGGILLASSANRSGEEPARSADQALRSVGNTVGAVLDAGTVQGGTPSTVARVRGRHIEIIREGAIPACELEATIEET